MPPTLQLTGAIDANRLERYLKRHPGRATFGWYAMPPFCGADAGMLYRLWVNFKYDEKGEGLDIPLDAVSNLLNSPLCRELGQEVYEIHESLRAPLLNHLRKTGRFGSPACIAWPVSCWYYLDYCGEELPSPAFAEYQRWTVKIPISNRNW
ncbi:MAG: hypothetical protein H6556_23080 [Lewinellaceae bacterium]|nr:hypothetical protein [Lewinellaceae bacterium]